MAIAIVDNGDGITWTGGLNDNVSNAFSLLGGKYAIEVYSSGTPSAQLKINVDGTNYVAVAAAATTYAVYDLPPGRYTVTMGAAASTSTGALIKIPQRTA